MPSPFPGMDPYIEQPEVWSDFHTNLVTEIQGQLNPAIHPKYVARLVPRVTYETVEIEERRHVRPDVGVWQPQPPAGSVAVTTTGTPAAPVISLVVAELPLRLYTVEIHLVETMKLVTAIEILSPVNKKPGHEAYDDYLRKRQELLRSSAHLVEIDLLRAGKRPPLERPVPEAPYYITVSRADRRPYVEVWPLQLAEPLLKFPIPLLAPDPDVLLDLGKAVAACYERGGYDVIINYTHDVPPPKLSQENELWVDQLLRTKRLR